MHHYPSEGTPRDVANVIVSALFKNSPKSIPLIAITGTNGKTTTTRIVAHTLRGLGYIFLYINRIIRYIYSIVSLI